VRPIKLIDGGEPKSNEIISTMSEVPRCESHWGRKQGLDLRQVLLVLSGSALRKSAIQSANSEKLKKSPRPELAGGRPLIEDSRFRDRIAALELEISALDITVLRVLSAEAKKGKSGRSSVAEIKGSEISAKTRPNSRWRQSVSTRTIVPESFELKLARRTGRRGRVGHGEQPLFNVRKTTIFGGSTRFSATSLRSAFWACSGRTTRVFETLPAHAAAKLLQVR